MKTAATWPTGMDIDGLRIEAAAEDVLLAHEIRDFPVNPFAIAELEEIKLAPGGYEDCFESRIEYWTRNGRGRFFLFYREEERPLRPEGRVRFSVAHELGHFYIPEHRDYVLSGQWHGSRTDFVSTVRTEREADLFAASLLMPRRAFSEWVYTRAGGKCTLRELSRIANEVFRTSLTSTAIRYAQIGFEACAIVVSANGRVRYAHASEDMRYQGLGWIPFGSAIPNASVTATVVSGGQAEADGARSSEIWFPGKRSRRIWEEAMALGRTNLVLTLLAVDGPVEDGDEDDD